jgi:hypothetical protein
MWHLPRSITYRKRIVASSGIPAGKATVIAL